MSKSIEGAIECPFYLEEGKNFIKCEGILNGTVCAHNFTSKLVRSLSTSAIWLAIVRFQMRS